MRAVVQRVSAAKVTVHAMVTGEVTQGLTVLLGVGVGDGVEDARYIASKCANLRVFEDEQDKLNLSVKDVGGSVLLVSQFTLYGDARKGNRPSFIKAARPEDAEALCQEVEKQLIALGVPVQTGRFRTHMVVSLDNDGPVTILLDSKKEF